MNTQPSLPVNQSKDKPVVLKWRERLIGPFPNPRDACVWANTYLKGELWTYRALFSTEDIQDLRNTEDELRAVKARLALMG